MESRPHITIAICTFNRADYLRDTLKDIAAQTANPRFFELLVINNNSDDHTESVCDRFSQTNPAIRFRVVDEKDQGLSFARNRAAKEAFSETLFFIDDDVNLPANYVEKAVQYAKKRPNTLCAGGRIRVSFDEEKEEPNWIPKELMPMFGQHDLGNEDKMYPPSNFPRGGNMMIRKSVFNAFGVFDTSLGRSGDILLGSEEKAFFERIRKNGIQLRYWAGLELTHRIGSHRLKTDYLKKQSIGIGRSERLRVRGSVKGYIKKVASEEGKMAVSILLAIAYLIRLRPRAALFILRFRIWVMKGFLQG
ncbi:MAG: glycosyltransferase [Balneolaceae bacterium]